MATSKVLNRNRLRTMFVNLWKLFYCFPNVYYYYLNGNSEDLLDESLTISTNTFPSLVSDDLLLRVSQTPKATICSADTALIETRHVKGLFLQVYCGGTGNTMM